jgi:hypothetical protein
MARTYLCGERTEGVVTLLLFDSQSGEILFLYPHVVVFAFRFFYFVVFLFLLFFFSFSFGFGLDSLVLCSITSFSTVGFLALFVVDRFFALGLILILLLSFRLNCGRLSAPSPLPLLLGLHLLLLLLGLGRSLGRLLLQQLLSALGKDGLLAFLDLLGDRVAKGRQKPVVGTDLLFLIFVILILITGTI